MGGWTGSMCKRWKRPSRLRYMFMFMTFPGTSVNISTEQCHTSLCTCYNSVTLKSLSLYLTAHLAVQVCLLLKSHSGESDILYLQNTIRLASQSTVVIISLLFCQINEQYFSLDVKAGQRWSGCASNGHWDNGTSWSKNTKQLCTVNVKDVGILFQVHNKKPKCKITLRRL